MHFLTSFHAKIIRNFEALVQLPPIIEELKCWNGFILENFKKVF